MSSPPLTPFQRAWHKWKSLRTVPWRKRFLIGLDLQGNTFWEFRDSLSADPNRMRRIVQYPRQTHYSEVNISPQWHQWLRHTRQDAPTLQEQSMDVVRQRNLKVLAAAADKRWAEKASFLDRPKGDGLPLGGLGISDAGRLRGEAERGRWNIVLEVAEGEGVLGQKIQKAEETQPPEKIPRFSERTDVRRKEQKQVGDPWKQARGGPSEDWQPEQAQIRPAKR